jgi:hypothetical protein
MELINFITGQPYIAPHHEDIKIAVICPDGTMLLADKSFDNVAMQDFGINSPQYARIETHIDYFYILCKKFFPDNHELQKMIQKNDLQQINLYAIIVELVNSGFILFNNNTTYEGPTFFLHGKHGQVLIPQDVVTENQKETLSILEPFLSDFGKIEIKQYVTKQNKQKRNGRLDCIDSSMDEGKRAISKYLHIQQKVYEKTK